MKMLIESMIALLAGGAIGIAFGMIQDAALRRHQEKEQKGEFKSGWSLMPGSGGRVAMLLMTLVVVQFVCPLLFMNGIQWWVSGGVVGGYGWTLLQHLRKTMAHNS